MASYKQKYISIDNHLQISMRLTIVREKFKLCFSTVFAVIDKKKLFWQEDWALGYHCIRLRHFPHISYFPKS